MTVTATGSDARARQVQLVGEPGLLARIVRLQLLVSEQLDAVAGRHGLNFGDYLVLGVIRRSPEGRCAPSQICEILHRTSGGMTLTLDRLAAAGWLERAPDPADRRKVVLTLTEAGAALAERTNAALHEWEAALGLPAGRVDDAQATLDDLLALLD